MMHRHHICLFRTHVVQLPLRFLPRSAKGECPIYKDRNGKMIPAMCADYGFRSGSGRLYQEFYGEVPKDVWQLVRS